MGLQFCCISQEFIEFRRVNQCSVVYCPLSEFKMPPKYDLWVTHWWELALYCFRKTLLLIVFNSYYIDKCKNRSTVVNFDMILKTLLGQKNMMSRS